MPLPTDTTALRELSELFSLTDKPHVIEDFLLSLLTENEIAAISSRWSLVCLIEEGMSQRAIAKKLGISLCKITRGSRELKRKNSPFAKMIQLSKEKNTAAKKLAAQSAP